MALLIPKIVLLDSSTLGTLARDHYSAETACRDKSREFISQLLEFGVIVGFTLTHLVELLRHGDGRVVEQRLEFLQGLPFIAWLRPYDGNHFLGSVLDLLRYELHAVIHGSAGNWLEIVNQVRPRLWEMGQGSELFVQDNERWATLQDLAHHMHEAEVRIASAVRTDAGKVMSMQLADARRRPICPNEDRRAYACRFARETQAQLERHGDKRLSGPRGVAADLTNDALNQLASLDGRDNLVRGILESNGVSLDCIDPDMTIEQIGDLAVYTKQLAGLASGLRPPADCTAKDIPPGTLPSKVLELELAAIQRKALRVSGSDLGDKHIAPLVLYADGVEVDKRTHEFLDQIRRSRTDLGSMMGCYFRSSDCSKILEHVRTL